MNRTASDTGHSVVCCILLLIIFLGTGHQFVQNTDHEQRSKQKAIVPWIKKLFNILACSGNLDRLNNQLPQESNHGNFNENNHIKDASLHIVDFSRNEARQRPHNKKGTE